MRAPLSLLAGAAALMSAIPFSVPAQGMMAPPPVSIVGTGSVSSGAGAAVPVGNIGAAHGNAAATVLGTGASGSQTGPATVLTSPPSNADLANAASVLGTEAVFAGGMSYPLASATPGNTITYTPDILVFYPTVSPRRLQDLLASSRQQPGKESFPAFSGKAGQHSDVESLKGASEAGHPATRGKTSLGKTAAKTDMGIGRPSIEHDATGTTKAASAAPGDGAGTPFVTGTDAPVPLPQAAANAAPVPAAPVVRNGASSQDFSAHLEAGARGAKR